MCIGSSSYASTGSVDDEVSGGSLWARDIAEATAVRHLIRHACFTLVSLTCSSACAQEIKSSPRASRAPKNQQAVAKAHNRAMDDMGLEAEAMESLDDQLRPPTRSNSTSPTKSRGRGSGAGPRRQASPNARATGKGRSPSPSKTSKSPTRGRRSNSPGKGRLMRVETSPGRMVRGLQSPQLQPLFRTLRFF